MGIVRTAEPVTIAKAGGSVAIHKAGFDKAMKLMVKLAALGGWDRERAIEVMKEALDDLTDEVYYERDQKKVSWRRACSITLIEAC